MYVIFFKGQPVYVGKSKALRGRLRQHFIKKSDSTSSVLAYVEKFKRKNIQFSYISVPESLYSSLEESIILKFSKNKVKIRAKNSEILNYNDPELKEKKPWWGRRAS